MIHNMPGFHWHSKSPVSYFFSKQIENVHWPPPSKIFSKQNTHTLKWPCCNVITNTPSPRYTTYLPHGKSYLVQCFHDSSRQQWKMNSSFLWVWHDLNICYSLSTESFYQMGPIKPSHCYYLWVFIDGWSSCPEGHECQLKEHDVSLYLPLRTCWYFNAGISFEAILLEKDEEADQKLIIGVPWSIPVY